MKPKSVIREESVELMFVLLCRSACVYATEGDK